MGDSFITATGADALGGGGGGSTGKNQVQVIISLGYTRDVLEIIGGSLVGVWKIASFRALIFAKFRSLKFGKNRSFRGNSRILLEISASE